jgi:hypothetical protein
MPAGAAAPAVLRLGKPVLREARWQLDAPAASPIRDDPVPDQVRTTRSRPSSTRAAVACRRQRGRRMSPRPDQPPACRTQVVHTGAMSPRLSTTNIRHPATAQVLTSRALPLDGLPGPLMPQTRTTSTNLPRAGAQGLPCALELAWSRPVFGTPAVSQTAVVCASDLGVTAGQRLCVRSGEFPGQGLYNPMCNPTRSCSPNRSSPDLLHAYTARRPDHADMAVELRY